MTASLPGDVRVCGTMLLTRSEADPIIVPLSVPRGATRHALPNLWACPDCWTRSPSDRTRLLRGRCESGDASAGPHAACAAGVLTEASPEWPHVGIFRP